MGENIKEKIVISAINFDSGGPLSILNDCLLCLSEFFSEQYEIIALVHSKDVCVVKKGIEFYEFPKSKKAWFFRLYYEYFYFKKLSKKIGVNHWISLHDITPNVIADYQYVYCHNPSPFYKMKNKGILENPKVYLFTKFYKYLYKINIKKNKYVVVQQDWMRKEFNKFWGLMNIVVAYPDITPSRPLLANKKNMEGKKIFFYPSFPRPFKNFEVICEAYTMLPEIYQNKSEIRITIDGQLNKYAKKIANKYKDAKGITFMGLLTRKDVFKQYDLASCLIFPSQLETWGLPITEFKEYKKPIILANLPYAHETLGNYDKAAFFNPNLAEELKEIMMKAIDEQNVFFSYKKNEISHPITKGWEDFFNFILNNND